MAEDLGVQYVLEGSVRMSGDTVRVTAQLIDAINGYHLWSERYDRSVKDIFALQDEITMRILTELRVKLTDGEVCPHICKRNKQSSGLLESGGREWVPSQYNKEANAEAIRLLREAMELDPHYAMAYIRLSCALTDSVYYGNSESPEETLSNALKVGTKGCRTGQLLG